MRSIQYEIYICIPRSSAFKQTDRQAIITKSFQLVILMRSVLIRFFNKELHYLQHCQNRKWILHQIHTFAEVVEEIIRLIYDTELCVCYWNYSVNFSANYHALLIIAG